MTEYTLLRYNPATNSYERIQGNVTASSPKRAIREFANGSHIPGDSGEGEYVAVPARSWKPLTVKVEQTTKVTIT